MTNIPIVINSSNNQIKPYPEYDKLLNLAQQRMLTDTKHGLDVNLLSTTINSITDPNHLEELAALCLHHSLRFPSHPNLTGPVSCLVYNSRTVHGGKGIIYSIEELPALLQHILSLYMEQYL